MDMNKKEEEYSLMIKTMINCRIIIMEEEGEQGSKRKRRKIMAMIKRSKEENRGN